VKPQQMGRKVEDIMDTCCVRSNNSTYMRESSLFYMIPSYKILSCTMSFVFVLQLVGTSNISNKNIGFKLSFSNYQIIKNKH